MKEGEECQTSVLTKTAQALTVWPTFAGLNKSAI